MEHRCLHEADIATMAANIQTIAKDVSAIKSTLNNGLKTDTALNKASIKRLWWWTGGISLSIIGAAIWIIRSGVNP